MSTTPSSEAEKPAKVLVLGSGGREHALAYKLYRSQLVEEVYVYPGNAAQFWSVDEPLDDPDSVVAFCKRKEIDLVVIGPENLLYQGYAEKISPFVKCFGPTKEAARLEWSKSYAKQFMRKTKIPTADFQVFTDLDSTTKFINESEWKNGFVVKANGLAEGKGVAVVDTAEEAILAAKEMLVDGKFGEAGREILLEQRLEGTEVSAFFLTDGKTIRMLPLVKDYKRLLNCDKGPNTGGMGAIGPVFSTHKKIPTSVLTLEHVQEKKLCSELESLCQRTVAALRSENIQYKGVLYVGAMITEDGIQVLEYNCRFGDPETEVLVRLLDIDLYKVFISCVDGTLERWRIECFSKFVCCVVIASEGYPVKPRRGAVITGMLEANADFSVVVFHAGTKLKGNDVIVNGGRVLCVTAIAPSIEQAHARAYDAARKIQFDGQYYRMDIGAVCQIKPVSYRDSGVSTTEGNEFVKRIKSICDRTKTIATESIGGFAASIDCMKIERYCMGNSQLEIGMDGVGTKITVAEDCKYYDEIGEDLVAMCANDVLCQAGQPSVFLFYCIAGSLPTSVHDQISASVYRACRKVGCECIEGDAVEMPGLYRAEQWDLVGLCIGARHLDGPKRPLKNGMNSGDILVGIASSGLHSNGFSLVRKIFADSATSYSETCPWDTELTFGEVLLRGTKLYSKSVLPALVSDAVMGASHITGGGLKENVDRILPKHLKAVINCDKWSVPEIFQWIHSMGPVESDEMLRTFNCGIGMVLVCKPPGVEKTLHELRNNDEDAFVIGVVQDRAEGEDQVEFVHHSKAFHQGFSKQPLVIPSSFKLDLKCSDDVKILSESTGEDHFYSKGGAPMAFLDFSKLGGGVLGNSQIAASCHVIGSKLAIATEVGYYEGIGQDLVAVCSNDLLCRCVKPVAFLDYYVTGHLQNSSASAIVDSIAYACEEIGCALVGGETAEMPGVYKSEQWDLAGVCIGAKDLEWPECPLPTSFQVDDLLICIPSNGLHTAGFSLVRKIFAQMNISCSDKCPWDETSTFAKELLRSTRLYTKAVLPAVRSTGVIAAAQIAEGGLTNCVQRILPSHVKAVIDCGSWSIPAVFEWIQSMGGVSFQKMMNTFNCGIGMVLVCKPKAMEETLRILEESGEIAYPIGHLENCHEGEDQVEYIREFTVFRALYGREGKKLINIAIFTSGAATDVKHLIESSLGPQSICRVTAVISNDEDAAGLKTAKSYGIFSKAIKWMNGSGSKEEFEGTALTVLAKNEIQLICFAGFTKILSKDFIRRFDGQILDSHLSVLPNFSGPTPVEDALKAGALVTGCTVHYVTEEGNCGGIVAQVPVTVLEDDTVETLRSRIQAEVNELYPVIMHKVAKQLIEK